MHNFLYQIGFMNKKIFGNRKFNPELNTDLDFFEKKITEIFTEIFFHTKNMTFQNKGFGEMPSSRLDSRRNSVQNGMVEKFTVFMATIFMPNFRFYVTATFCRP